MTSIKVAIAAISTLFLLACTHPIDIIGNGDVLSESGARNCYLENEPCEFTIVNAYQEVYSPAARDGWYFVSWENCQRVEGPRCFFDVPLETVQAAYGNTAPALTAVFRERPVKPPIGDVIVTGTVTSCFSSYLPYEEVCAPRIGDRVEIDARISENYLEILWEETAIHTPNQLFHGEYLLPSQTTFDFNGRADLEGSGNYHEIFFQLYDGKEWMHSISVYADGGYQYQIQIRGEL